ncbi:hypothetical protein Jab_1c17980 [Janthinobacterium sp. HH01]|uniref:hypothetical protein n=1 Tax=Janthinobacterium sp. HH01 TaxID=1198452 RepID=UPI0002AE960C|nr:hypothetical protein [Janthinobacterium sp. HH01]ELX13176.1 hypothetical protein Jab_1c17980 [Janthinobacterium sp. HH01]
MNFPELAAPTLQPHSEQYHVLPLPPFEAGAPQSWMVSVADAKYHWYDLVAGFPETPDIRDPIGRYQRRMQFELEALAAKHHLFFAVIRPRVRFDIKGAIQWGFFSLKLTLPLLMGADEAKESITIELKVPFAATMKKPTVTLTPNFITLNWGGLIEAFSIHDILQNYAHALKIPSKVVYVGQTRDNDARLSKGRLPALQKLHAQHSEHFDTLLLVQQLDVQVSCADGDPAEAPHDTDPLAADALQGERMDVVEAALIHYFEGPATRNHEQRTLRAARLGAVQAGQNLAQFTIDLQYPDAGRYNYLCSAQVDSAKRHLLSCFIADGQAKVTPMPLPPQAKSAKAAKG